MRYCGNAVDPCCITATRTLLTVVAVCGITLVRVNGLFGHLDLFTAQIHLC